MVSGKAGALWRVAAVLAIALLLGGCGNYGPLELPEQGEAKES